MFSRYHLAVSPVLAVAFACSLAFAADAAAAKPRPARPERAKNGGLTAMTIPGGSIRSLVASAADPERLWALDDTVTFWRSDDAGERWQRLGEHPRTPRLVVTSPVDRDVLWAADAYGQGIYRSTDGGASFTRRDDGSLDEPEMTALAADPLAASTLYVGGSRGIWASRDGGVSWVLASPQPVHSRALVADPSRSGRVWARVGNLEPPLWTSADGGVTWSPVATPFAGNSGLLVVDAARPGRLLVAGGSDPAGAENHVWETTDDGATWTDLGSPAPEDRLADLALAADGSSWALVAVSSDPRSRLFRRAGGATAWSEVASPNGLYTTDLLTLPAPAGKVLVSTLGGIRRFTGNAGGGRWERPEREPAKQEITHLAVSALPPTVYAGTLADGLYNSLVSGELWLPIQPPPAAAASVVTAVTVLSDQYPPMLYLAVACPGLAPCVDGRRGRIYRSENEGSAWEEAGGGLPDGVASALVQSPRDPLAVWAIFDGAVWRTRNGGASWQRANDGLAEGDTLGSLAIAPDVEDHLLLGTLGGRIYRWQPSAESWELRYEQSRVAVGRLSMAAGGVAWAALGATHIPAATLLRSSDGGATWSEVPTPFSGAWQGILDLAATRDAPRELWVVSHDHSDGGSGGTRRAGLWRSRDGGTSFELLVERNDLSTVAPFPDARGVAFIGSASSGLYRYIDPCAADADTLCLLGNRMRVEGSWHNPYDDSRGTTLVRRQSDLTGVLAFANPDNPELIVKTADLGHGDDRPDVFVGHLTDLEYLVRVVDTRTGELRWFADNSEWCPPAEPEVVAIEPGICSPAADTLCLEGGRLRVRAHWDNQYDGSSGAAGHLPYSPLASWLTFSDPALPELLVKALDFGDRTLLFWGALTDLGYRLTVDDLATGTSRSFVNRPRWRCGGFATW